MGNAPADRVLYDQIRSRVIRTHPTNSAYRSGLIVKKYKEAYANKHGSGKAYLGAKTRTGLTRWFQEKWTNESGGIGYDRKNTLYRPTVRVSKDTPKTWGELDKTQIRRAKREKKTKGRVKRFVRT
jgi:hypothetical protein